MISRVRRGISLLRLPARPARRFRLATARYRVLPSFIIIGAQRAGTTTLLDSLRSHPDIVGPRPSAFVHAEELARWRRGWLAKELHFFDARFDLGLDWYRSFFPTTAARWLLRRTGRDLVAGESTPYYLFHPLVPERLAATLPEVRLIAVLRDPVDRAYSHYHLMRRKRLEKLSFADAVAAEEERLAGKEARILADPTFRSYQHRHHTYLSRGLYAEQLERWFAHFPREQFLILRSEDLFARPADVFGQVLEFLGVRAMPLTRIRHRNQSSYPKLDSSVRAQLEDFFAEPNAQLARLLGEDLAWNPSTSAAQTPATGAATPIALRPQR
jgi:Sulfotransferase domain